MNLLFLTYQGDIAGSTNSIAYLADGLARNGHQVYVGARQESLLFRLLQSSPAHRLPMTFTGKFDLTNMRQIREAVQTYRIDLMNAQSSLDRYTSIFARWLYRLPVKLVHTRRQVSRSTGFGLQNWLYVKGTDVIVAVSDGVKRSLIQQGLPPQHIVVIPNGIPLEKCLRAVDEQAVMRLKQQYDIQPGDIVIGCVARKKKQEQLLQALQLIPFPTKVLLVGLDADEIAPELLPSIQPRHTVIFCGKVSPEAALHYYRLLTLHVLPSTIEGLSQTLLEAMAFGVPVIATRAAGNLDVIKEGENGFFFADNQPRELADKIIQVIEHPECLPVVLENARRTATETFALTRTIAAYEELFQQLIGS